MRITVLATRLRRAYRDWMTESTDLVTWSDERAGRVLDAAADLLVRWGYQRVTIDEVARLAGVGKGTVYLHFRSKDAMFLSVLLRSHHTLISAMAARMEDDPDEVLPSRMMRSVYLDLVADPIARPLYLGDGEVLGRLAHEAAATLGGIGELRDAIVREQVELLRAAGAMRTDLGVDAQLYVLTAVGAGFFFVHGSLAGPGTDTDVMPQVPADPIARADLLAHAIASALETGAQPTAALAGSVAARYRSLVTHIQEEGRRRSR
jgi:AcrR family transcriptional regulator